MAKEQAEELLASRGTVQVKERTQRVAMCTEPGGALPFSGRGHTDFTLVFCLTTLSSPSAPPFLGGLFRNPPFSLQASWPGLPRALDSSTAPSSCIAVSFYSREAQAGSRG